MKLLVRILPIIIFLASCSSNTNNDDIKKKIIRKKQQIVKIEQQISELEKKLTDSTDNEKYIPVSVKEMTNETFNHYFIVYGNVEADKYGNISPEMGGKIRKIHVREGQRVEKGTLLVSLNTEAVEKNISALETNLKLATTSYEKLKTLWEQEIGSEIQYLQAKANKESIESQLAGLKAQLRMASIISPYSGVVNKIYQKVGEIASPGFPVIEFVNLSNMTVKAQVSEKHIAQVSTEQLVDLSFSSLPNFNLKTPIVRVSKVINPKSRTFEIELNLKNDNELIKPNMVSTIKINDYSNKNSFIIPSLAVKKDLKGDYIYLVDKNGDKTIAKKNKVTLGKSYQDKTEVISGLKTGDKVIVKGYNLVSSGVYVKIK